MRTKSAVRRPRPDRRLSATHPHLVAEWHPENELTPEDVSRGSDYRAKWHCALARTCVGSAARTLGNPQICHALQSRLKAPRWCSVGR
ncbi:zinc-ribbon domain-containing protein [Mycobacteroides abscessus]|uniref:zinc-ribbon domain-containing protein n=1 Tax=Mycobacteroides abscessus TaxID=36809 RepID=UPI0009A69319|nr:zinc-ribbon domain-containing protein [Mycobacteroides abscessus]